MKKNRSTNKVKIILGISFGDEGKGKVVDVLTQMPSTKVIVRFHGGANAGHTLIVKGKKTVLHLIPSGIISNKLSFLGNGVAFDPVIFAKEIEELKAAGVNTDLVKVSENAHVVMPYHIETDKMRETKFKIGTTQKGIGPTYEDKAARRGILVKDLFDLEALEKKIARRFDQLNLPNNSEGLAKEFFDRFAWIKKHMVSSNFLQDKKGILFEGAQSSLLDVDHGFYPYVTSSNCVAMNAGIGAGISLFNIPVDVIGVFKAYITKVGEGPFPTSIEGTPLADEIRQKGKEFGSTTGRPRHIGWLDLVSLKEVICLNGVTTLCLMKSDVLCGQKEVKICTDYKDGNPVYKTLPGWNSLKDKQFNIFVKFIEKIVKRPIKIISYGPGREETIIVSNL